MDPSYEMSDEYQQAATAVANAQKRWETGTFALWYPVVDRESNQWLEKKVKQATQRPTLLVELAVEPDQAGYGMTASGMIVINPPWKLYQQLEVLLPWLSETLGCHHNAKQRLVWLCEEA
jgi:23S rRNA (adenine2030-N6)-methyltransferase